MFCKENTTFFFFLIFFFLVSWAEWGLGKKKKKKKVQPGPKFILHSVLLWKSALKKKNTQKNPPPVSKEISCICPK